MSMSDLREYKCPACGGAIEFDSKSQKMKCPYCDTEFELETLKELDEQMEREAGQQDDLSGWQTDAGGEWQEGETDGMNVYTCQSCGGEIIADENTGASNCPYCGNPVIMTEKFKGALRPDLVIPFKLDKKAAKEAYYRHIKGRTFLCMMKSMDTFFLMTAGKIILMRLRGCMFRSGFLTGMLMLMCVIRRQR